jgi:hypothetical protein
VAAPINAGGADGTAGSSTDTSAAIHLLLSHIQNLAWLCMEHRCLNLSNAVLANWLLAYLKFTHDRQLGQHSWTRSTPFNYVLAMYNHSHGTGLALSRTNLLSPVKQSHQSAKAGKVSFS